MCSIYSESWFWFLFIYLFIHYLSRKYAQKCLKLYSNVVRFAKSCPHELQHPRLPCPSPSSRVCPNLCMMSQWAGTPISNIFQFVVIYIVESFRVVNEAEIDVFMGLPCFLHDPTNAGNLIYICICLYIYIYIYIYIHT